MKIKEESCITDALHVLVTFVQFQKCEKHQRRKVSFSKVAANGTKSGKASHIGHLGHDRYFQDRVNIEDRFLRHTSSS